MKNVFFGVLFGVVLVTGIATAAPITWDMIVGDDVIANGNNIVMGVGNNVDDQSQGFHGGGFIASDSKIAGTFNVWSYDSYSSTDGWYDVFVVNINQDGYVFDSPWVDPVTTDTYAGGMLTTDVNLPGTSVAWGGKSWQDNTIESLAGTFSLSLNNYDPTKDVFVSVFWKTDYDELYNSGGCVTVDVAPVPEPATMLLFGTGLAGLAGGAIRRRKKRDEKGA